MAKTVDYYRHDRAAFLNWVGGRFERVLDVGCGAGANADWYRGHGAQHIAGIELDAESAARAGRVFDQVVCGPVETALPDLTGAYDLIVCADVLEHLVDPWTVVRELRRVATEATALAMSVPNIQFVGALARIAVGGSFRYESQGIFDQTHLRFFTRSDLDRMLIAGGWSPDRRGAEIFGRARVARRLAGRITGGRSDRWLAEQLYTVAHPSDGHAAATGDRTSRT